MAAPNLGINTNAHARDVTFTFNDSCNCCCWGKQPPERTFVYVHNDGQVERIKESKANDKAVQDAIRANMRASIVRAAPTRDSHRVVRHVQKRSGVDLEASVKQLTLEDARNVDAAVKAMLANPISTRFESSSDEEFTIDVDAVEHTFRVRRSRV